MFCRSTPGKSVPVFIRSSGVGILSNGVSEMDMGWFRSDRDGLKFYQQRACVIGRQIPDLGGNANAHEPINKS